MRISILVIVICVIASFFRNDIYDAQLKQDLIEANTFDEYKLLVSHWDSQLNTSQLENKENRILLYEYFQEDFIYFLEFKVMDAKPFIKFPMEVFFMELNTIEDRCRISFISSLVSFGLPEHEVTTYFEKKVRDINGAVNDVINDFMENNTVKQL